MSARVKAKKPMQSTRMRSRYPFWRITRYVDARVDALKSVFFQKRVFKKQSANKQRD